MFELTEGAKGLLDQHFQKQEKVSPIRVYMAPG